MSGSRADRRQALVSTTTDPMPTAPISVALLTGGSDKPYALGLASALSSQGIHVDFVGSDELRRSLYLRTLGMATAPAREVRVFGLGPWLGARFHRTWESAMAPVFVAWPSGRAMMVTRAAVPGPLMPCRFAVLPRQGLPGPLSPPAGGV